MRGRCELCILGAGPAGIAAAIAAADAGIPGEQIFLLEEKEKTGSKIYVTGNGRCNLANLHQGPECYHTDSSEDPYRFLSGCGAQEVMEFFRREGILLHERRGCVYPRTDQAADAARALERALRKRGIEAKCAESVLGAVKDGDRFLVRTDQNTFEAEKLILCTGGKVGGSGIGEKISRGFGLSFHPFIPALTFLVTKDPLLKVMAGVRARGEISLFADGAFLRKEQGEIQIGKDTISGIPSFNLAGTAGRALESGKKVKAVIDFLPELTPEEKRQEAARRVGDILPGDTLACIFYGLVQEKIASYLIRKAGYAEEKKTANLKGDKKEILSLLLSLASHVEFDITGTGDFSKAQVCAGGAGLEEVNPDTMEAKKRKGLYLAGEILDCDGICGGYNLTFAFGTGLKAGRSAALSLMQDEKK